MSPGSVTPVYLILEEILTLLAAGFLNLRTTHDARRGTSRKGPAICTCIAGLTPDQNYATHPVEFEPQSPKGWKSVTLPYHTIWWTPCPLYSVCLQSLCSR